MLNSWTLKNLDSDDLSSCQSCERCKKENNYFRDVVKREVAQRDMTRFRPILAVPYAIEALKNETM